MVLELTDLNPEVQEVYGSIVNVKSVAEDSLKLADFIPSPGNVIVEPIPPDDQTKGGLVLPEQARTDKNLGWVVAIHPSDDKHHVGDLVFYRFGGGQQVRIENRDVIILQFTDRISDILGHWPAGTLEKTA